MGWGGVEWRRWREGRSEIKRGKKEEYCLEQKSGNIEEWNRRRKERKKNGTKEQSAKRMEEMRDAAKNSRAGEEWS